MVNSLVSTVPLSPTIKHSVKKLDYLINALKFKCYKKKAWVISMLAITHELDALNPDKIYPYKIVRTPPLIQFINPIDNRLIIIEDALLNEPLFTFQYPIKVTKDICSNVTNEVETTLGNLLFNLICIVESFGTKIDFINKVNLSKIEDYIAERLKDVPPEGEDRNPNYIYVDEYLKFGKSLSYLKGFSQLCVICTTKKTIVGPPGIDKFKKDLINTKYKDKLTDPVEFTKFISDCQDFDEKYLEGDPTNGKFLSGKIKTMSRRKKFLAFGVEPGFKEVSNQVPIITSLQDGLSKDPKAFTDMMNESRAGSFARGSETVEGGVKAKAILRATDNIKIINEDCMTKLGLPRTHTEFDYEKLTNRYILLEDKWILIDNNEVSKKYIGKKVITRSPQYCKLQRSEQSYCSYCLGINLSQNPSGIAAAVTEISSVILSTSMAAMHGKVIKTNLINIDTAFT